MRYSKSRPVDYGIIKNAGRNGENTINGNPLIRASFNGKERINGYAHTTIKDIICFSHLRWNFVFQRPQHILSRWAKETRVFYFEEPVFGDFETNFLKTIYSNLNSGITIITPHIKHGTSESDINSYLKQSVNDVIKWYQVEDYLLWYLTPMAMTFSSELKPKMVVYDSMDELSAFKGAHPDMLNNENLLFRFADVVFTGGFNLYEYKKNRHDNIYPFPSSIDHRHFESGSQSADPDDQAGIKGPRVGFYGVIDERLDIELLDKLALLLPDYQFIMIGPVVKIDPGTLPRHENIHYLGQKSYKELPAYLAHWDVAFLPFARNESTRFISPTKTPEYLCAGKPVVSTSIHDVINPYGEMGIVQIADTAEDFASAILKVMKQKDDILWQVKVKDFLKLNSWDLTWSKMKEVIYKILEDKENVMEATLNKENGRYSSVNE